jgi:putative MATE family efflux protein
LAARTAAILEGPVVPTLLRLGLPTLIVLVVQTLVGVAETYFIGFLGTDALAGVALVFPVLMLMQMMSNGGIGGGVSSAVARAVGAGRRADAEALLFHALVLAAGLGAVFMAGALLGGPALYRSLGGAEGSLAAALTYSNLVFIGSIPLWLVALLSGALRGAGNVKVPALVIFVGASVTIPLSPALIFGVGPLPRLGIGGAGLAVAIYYTGAALVLIRYLASPLATLRLRRSRLEWRLFRDILGVGALSAAGTVQSNLTVALVTGAVGGYAAQEIAGFGIASRLDYMLIPLLFGFGTAVVTMVATQMGAGQVARARRIAWIGAWLAFCVTEPVGIAAALFAPAWAGLFSADPTVIGTATLYLHRVAPFYGIFGLGMMLYFASQGANRVIWAFLAGTVRLVLAGLGGWIAARWFGAGLGTLFAIVAAALVLFGLISAAATVLDPWRRRGR